MCLIILQPIPANVFVIGACNPHRGNSLALSEEVTSWVRSSYYVDDIHPTLQFLKWDYGSLSTQQEKEYVTVKLQMIDNVLPSLEAYCLSDLIAQSQESIRDSAYQHYVASGVDGEVAQEHCINILDII